MEDYLKPGVEVTFPIAFSERGGPGVVRDWTGYVLAVHGSVVTVKYDLPGGVEVVRAFPRDRLTRSYS